MGAIDDDHDTAPFPGILNCGSVYTFEKQGGAWVQVGKIQLASSETFAQEHFGWRVALTDDSLFVSGQATVRVFAFGGAFLQQLTATGGTGLDGFGQDLDVSGNRLVVGAHGYAGTLSLQGAAYVFEESGGTWSQVAQLVASDALANDQFGYTAAIEGDRAVVGSKGAGRVHLFHRQPSGAWTETAKLAWPGSAGFGYAVGLSGERILVGTLSTNVIDGVTFRGAAFVGREAGPTHVTYGTGTPGCNGALGMSAGAAELGSAVFNVRTDHAPSSPALGLGVIGDVPLVAGADPFGIGILLHVDLLLSAEVIPLDLFADAFGNVKLEIPVPTNVSLLGNVYYAQSIWAWTGGCTQLPPPYGLSSSRGVSFPVLAP